MNLEEVESEREIEITSTSTSTLAKLGYAILAAFGAEGSHLFEIEFDGRRFGHNFENENLVDITTIKLDQVSLSVGEKLNMVYDFGVKWKFNIEVLSVTPMKNGTGTHYSYIVSGNGDGITEDIFPTEISDTNSWNIDIANALYKGNVTRLQEIYEN